MRERKTPDSLDALVGAINRVQNAAANSLWPPAHVLRPSIVSEVFKEDGCAYVGRFQFFPHATLLRSF
jgi:hypothetical protein